MRATPAGRESRPDRRPRSLALALIALLAGCGDGSPHRCPRLCDDADTAGDPRLVTIDRLLREMSDVESLARIPQPSFRSHLESSHERPGDTPTHRSWFGNADAGGFVRMDGDRRVLLEVTGPGALVRIWAANPNGTWRFYVDGSEIPIIEAELPQITAGGIAHLGDPLAYVAARGHNVYLPLTFQESLKVTTDGGPQYYQMNYRTYEAGTRVEPFTLERLAQSPCARAEACHALDGEPPAPPGAELRGQLGRGGEPLVIAAAGPGGGAIRELRFDLADTSEAALRESVLTIAFDGEETVRAPLGDFFHGGPGLAPMRSLLADVTADGTMTARWVMPFQREARIAVDGAAVEAQVRHDEWTWDERSLYFHARWRPPQDLGVERLHEIRLVAITGTGTYVGTVLDITNQVQDWWGEGDERIRVDGERVPSWLGTGTEDYFGYAYSSNVLFSRPLHGQPRSGFKRNWGRTTNYRWHLGAPIPFERSLDFLLEVAHWKLGSTEQLLTYDAVSYWYARSGATIDFPTFDRPTIPELRPIEPKD
jgi:hypothetical protein